MFASDGRFFTLVCDKLPGARGHGEPLRLMIDLEENDDFVEVFVHKPGRKLLVAAKAGYGFIVPEDEMMAMPRKGKQVLNVDEPAEACACVPAEGDMVAVIGENRKMLVFPLDELHRDGARQGRQAAALQGRRPLRPARVQEGRGPHLARSGGPHLHAAVVGAEGLGGTARPGRPPGAQGLPQVQQVRPGVLKPSVARTAPCTELHPGDG